MLILGIPAQDNFVVLYNMKFDRARFAGPLLIIIAALLWSLDGILRANLRSIPPAFLVTLEHGLGLIPLLPILLLGLPQIRKASNKAKFGLVGTAILSGAMGTILYTAALGQVSFIPFSVVVLMQQTQPIFVIILSAIFLKEKISGKFLVHALFALIGAYLISFPTLKPDFTTAAGSATFAAAVLALGAAFSWGAGTILSKFALAEIDYKVATAARFFVTVIVAFLFSIALKHNVELASVSPTQWQQLLIIVFSAGMVALLIYYRGLSQTPAKISTFAELTWPLSAFAIDIARGITFAPGQLIGAIVLIIMIYRISAAYRDEDVRVAKTSAKPKIKNPKKKK